MTPAPIDGASPVARPVVSVCMASYNGSRYVGEQLRSILVQLDPRDEVVVVDDASTDATLDAIAEIGDSRIRVIPLPQNGGHVRAFEKALTAATGDVVLLADQDDLWPVGRVALMLRALQTHHLVAGNPREFPRPRELRGALSPRLDPYRWRNVVGLALGRRAYFGCAMGLDRSALAAALPFPRGTEAHDHWLAVLGNVRGTIGHLDEDVVLRRVHGDNQTPQRSRPLLRALRTRVVLARHVLAALGRRLPDA